MPTLIRVTTVPIALEHLLSGQLKFMRQHGFNVIAVSAAGKERDYVMQEEGCPHVVVNMTRTIAPIKDLIALVKLVYVFRKYRPDIVHTHTPKAGLLGMLAARMAGVRIKIHTVAGLPLMTATGIQRKILVATEKITYSAADYVLPNSWSLLKYIEDNKLCKARKLNVIGAGSTNGIDLNKFSREAVSEEALCKVRKRIDYNEGLFYFLFVGRVVRDKGIPELVEAFNTVNKEYPHCRLLIVGEVEKVRKGESLSSQTIDAINTHPAILHLGFDSDIAAFMTVADVFVFPSHREGFPNVLLQAAALKCPIICSDIIGNTDIVAHRSTGYIFKKNNVSELVQAMRYAMTSKEEMTIFSNRLFAQVVALYKRENVQRQLLKYYWGKLDDSYPVLINDNDTHSIINEEMRS